MKLRKIALTGALALGLSGMGGILAIAAHAVVVACGDLISQNTVLDADVGPSAIGIYIVANNITLDLNNHTIRGGLAGADHLPGIVSVGHAGVTIKNGTVREFGAGVSLEGGTTNSTVTRMVLQDNFAPVGDYGAGVQLSGATTTGNTITGNVARHNGPWEGIGLINGASGNIISMNLVEDNNSGYLDTGIVILGPASNNNTVTGNIVRGSTIDGIQGLGSGNTSSGNIITRNVVSGNGRHGIALFQNSATAKASDSTVTGNIVKDNLGDGVLVQSTNNTLSANRVSGSGGLDLHDTNATCDNNAWHANTGATSTPPCVLNP